jgi:hypothetical protein
MKDHMNVNIVCVYSILNRLGRHATRTSLRSCSSPGHVDCRYRYQVQITSLPVRSVQYSTVPQAQDHV